ncbi:MAG: rod shape-determining protein RodA [Acidobacteriota bacterium]
MRRLDFWLLGAVLVIGVCAFLAQTSTSQALANPAFARRQLIWLVVGLVVMLAVALLDYRVLARFSPLLYVVSIGMLLVMLVVAPLRAGTRSWLTFGSYTVQPSEFVRIATILAVAALAAEHRKDRLTLKVAAQIAALVILPALLVFLQPDLGVALTYAPILLAALWLGGLPWKSWLVLTVAGLVLVTVAWFWVLKPYQKERILTFTDPQRAPYGAGYQQRQSKIAVGSGGVTGKGLRSGTQSQLRFLPAQHTDFIFAVWAEETGFVGATVLLGAYALLVLRSFFIALHARDRTGALIAGSVGLVIAVEVVVNIAMVTGWAPTTGITLPLMSYGGSSVLASCLAVGLVESVWRLRFANV